MDKRQLTIFGIAFVLVGLFLLGSFNNSRQNRSNVGTEYTPPDAPAVIVNGERLYKEINSDRSFTELRDNLTLYAKLALPQQNNDELENASVTFKLSGDVKNKEGTISFEGVFEGYPDRISVRVKKLNNDKFSLSITNMKNGGNIDSRLPANSKYNQFAGSLPYKNELFMVEYNSSVNSFTVTALSPDASARQKAYNYITDGTGKQRSELKILYKPYLF